MAPPCATKPSALQATPARSSTPVKVTQPHYSPISPAKSSQSKSEIIMGNLTIEASNASSLMGRAGKVTSPASSNVDVVLQSDHDTADDLPEHDPNLESEGAAVKIEPEEVKQLTFPENVSDLPAMSNTKRIHLAYQYFPFKKKVAPPPRVVAEARLSDNECENAPAVPTPDTLENSFPISSFIVEAWQNQGKSFQNSMQESLSMQKATEHNADSVDQAPDHQPGASMEAVMDDDPVYADSFGSIFRGKPTKPQGYFFYNESKFAPFVKHDNNLYRLQRDPKKKWKSMVKLQDDEIKNVQIATSYGLYAESHCNAFIRASKRAINQTLLHLDPQTQSENVTRLQDAKKLLIGAVQGLEQAVDMFVYVNAGLTAKMRADFLQGQGDSIPMHVKQALLHEYFGGTGLFNSHIAQHLPEVDAHRERLRQEALNRAMVKSMQGKDSNNNNNSNRGNSRRGRGGGNNHNNRGRGNFHNQGAPQSQSNQNFQQSSPQDGASNNNNRGNRGRGRGGHRGNRGGKAN